MSVDALASPPDALTEKGMIVGTFLYMAPELLRGEQAGERSDIFSFGCVLYEMITGLRPFSGKSQFSLISAILEKEPEPITNVQPSTSPAVEHIVLRCLAKDPNDRWQTFRDIANELGRPPEASTVTKVVDAAAEICMLHGGWSRVARLIAVWALPAGRGQRCRSESGSVLLCCHPLPRLSFRIVSRFRRTVAGLPLSPLPVQPICGCVAFQQYGTADSFHRRRFVSVLVGGQSSDRFLCGRKTGEGWICYGAIEIVCDAPPSAGASWNSRGVILFTYNQSGPIFKVDATGGVPQAVTKPGDKQGHFWPLVFSRSRSLSLFFTRHGGTGAPERTVLTSAP